MNGELMTRQEAEKLAKELNETDPKWFCPLIKEDCNKRCINFISAFVSQDTDPKERKGFIHNIDDKDFYVDGFVCSAYIFTGPPCGF